ncbi:hypothetical protein ACLMJK_004911 [Lecanora helva]
MDRSLGTLLRALQNTSDHQEVSRYSKSTILRVHSDFSRLLGSATTLLTVLSNPLNITLLTTQLLSAPSVWQSPENLQTTVRILSIFNTAAIHFAQQQDKAFSGSLLPEQNILSTEEWVVAVVKGANTRSPRWRHLCVLVGLLVGLKERGQKIISTNLRCKLENAIVTAVNISLQDGELATDLASSSMAILLAHGFDLLSSVEKLRINYDLLLPVLYRAPFLMRDGLHSGYFLSAIDADVNQMGTTKFNWSASSSTYLQCQRIATGPLVTLLGALSRLTAFAVEHVQAFELLMDMVTDMSAFTRSLNIQWRQNKISEIDITEETTFLTDDTLNITLPFLLRILKSTMFAIVVILRSLLGRALEDPAMPLEGVPFVAIQTLHMLRNLYFISSRHGSNAFAQYSFTYLSAIDILSQYPLQAEAFLQDIKPVALGSIHQHPLDRCHDLYFLNTAEHFTILISPDVNEKLLIRAATPYLGLGSDPRLVEIFESAHSVILAVFAAPQNSDLLSKHLQPYLQTLFQVFPQSLSSRQFRLVIKTLVRITSPPSPAFEYQPLLPSTILELVRHRLQTASADVLGASTNISSSNEEVGLESSLSEQSVLALALIDALAYLPINQLEDWLPLVANSLAHIQDPAQLSICRNRYWQSLSGDEMNSAQAAFCLAWWSTGGGREMIFDGINHHLDPAFVSGALPEFSRL